MTKINYRVVQPAKNDVTGDVIQTKLTTNQYRNNWDAIFGKPKTFVCAGCNQNIQIGNNHICFSKKAIDSHIPI